MRRRKMRRVRINLSIHRNTFTWVNPAGFFTGVNVFNPIVKSKVPLVCKNNNYLLCYSCGPTVYDKTHIGHASSYVRLDIIHRILSTWFSIQPVVGLGMTDIDDKILQKANDLKEDYRLVSKKFEIDYFSSMESLNVTQPQFVLRVTEHIPEIQSFITEIIRNGHAYATSTGNVYFNTKSLAVYGKITRMPLSDAAESVNREKLHPSDFALWKAAKKNEPSWPSPWGSGRPGWHIECSAMASKLFGNQLDMHTGGLDLAFPHHENEEAQCCAYHSVDQWVNYWIHTGHLLMNGFKMSKSMKNFITVAKFLESNTADEFRMLCLMSHYRSSIDFRPEVMVKTRAMLNKFTSFISDARSYQKGTWDRGRISAPRLYEIVDKSKRRVREALADDFNTPICINILEEIVKEANIMLHENSDTLSPREPVIMAITADFIEDSLQSLGLLSANSMIQGNNGAADYTLDRTIAFRRKVRQLALKMEKKDERGTLLRACDELRTDLAAIGVTVKDTSQTNNT